VRPLTHFLEYKSVVLFVFHLFLKHILEIYQNSLAIVQTKKIIWNVVGIVRISTDRIDCPINLSLARNWLFCTHPLRNSSWASTDGYFLHQKLNIHINIHQKQYNYQKAIIYGLQRGVGKPGTIPQLPIPKELYVTHPSRHISNIPHISNNPHISDDPISLTIHPNSGCNSSPVMRHFLARWRMAQVKFMREGVASEGMGAREN